MKKHFSLFLLSVMTVELGGWPFFNTSQKAEPEVQKKPLTIMIDPAGDARNPGREIDETFERGLTLQFAQELKKLIESQITGVRIILTRFQGETLEFLQNASFSNRLQSDLYVSINFYQEENKIHNIYVYHLLYNPVTDLWDQRDSKLSFIPYDQAFKLSLKKTVMLANNITESLKKYSKEYHFFCHDLMGIPFRPLIGISAPSFGIEMGISDKLGWKNFIIPISKALTDIVIMMQNSGIS